MAASSEQNVNEEDNEVDDELNVLSASFNPLKALYSFKTFLPVVDASCFNNIAEYESFMAKSKAAAKAAGASAASEGEQPQPVGRGRGQASGGGRGAGAAALALGLAKPVGSSTTALSSSSTAEMSPRDIERLRAKQIREKTKELPLSTRFQKKRFMGNVLSHMYEATGPLDLLRQCVEKRCKIRVCIRSFKGLRSICVGFLVAFDKQMNLAMMDVDEIYKRPSTGKRFHHEEKVTYSMILGSLNPQKKEKQEQAREEKSKKETSKSEEKKVCKFCQIMHEAILEQEVAKHRANKPSLSDTEEGSLTDTSSEDGSSYSSPSDSESMTSTSGDQRSKVKGRGSTSSSKGNRGSKVKGKDGKERIKRVPVRRLTECPNGHRGVESGKKAESGLAETEKDQERSEQIRNKSDITDLTMPGSHVVEESMEIDNTGEKGIKGKEKDLVSKKTTLTASRKDSSRLKSDETQDAETNPSRITPIVPAPVSSAHESVVSSEEKLVSARPSSGATEFKKPAATKSSSVVPPEGKSVGAFSGSAGETASSTSASSLHSAFSKSLVLNPKAKRVGDKPIYSDNKPKAAPRYGQQQDSVAGNKPKEADVMPKKEKVHLDPVTGNRLIQPEEFKRRHVNQLFVRGDNVVLVSVESSMVTTVVPQPGSVTET